MFKTITEWLQHGAMESGYSLIESVAKETDKAIAFNCEKYNRAAYLYPTVVWFPKSRLIAVENDFYEKSEKTLYLAPNWLFEKKRLDGYNI
jgi:mannose-1-phosphate guanylyltransferase